MPPNTEGCCKHSALWHHLCYYILYIYIYIYILYIYIDSYSFHGLIFNSAVLFKPMWSDRVKHQAETRLL